ncbi:hypothetical protein X975_24420, partial [Stegodyphus mimosarum]
MRTSCFWMVIFNFFTSSNNSSSFCFEGCGVGLFFLGILSKILDFEIVFNSCFFEGTYPSFNEIKTGSASLPSIHSSAETAGMSARVSGYKSSWKRSDFLGTVKAMTSQKPRE